MVGGRKELLITLNKNKARFVIMARDEFTTQIPEHSDLKPSKYWDRRARGLGATFSRPAASCGEENLLALSGDPYAKENILIHEFAHALHRMALVQIDSSFQEKIEECFKNSIDQKIWEGTYASTNVNEYWAEGVQSWFNTNRENDRDHGWINTRKELKKADPKIAKLIEKNFGDSDWRYQTPHNRIPKSSHLFGFNPKNEKAFSWPSKLNEWYNNFEIGKISLAPKGSPTVLPLEIDSNQTKKSKFSKWRTKLYVRNLSNKSILLEWIDFDGRPKQKRKLRPKEHQEIFTFAYHVWQISHYEKNESIYRYELPKSQSSQINFKSVK